MSDSINTNESQEPRIPYAVDPLAFFSSDPKPKAAKKKKATKGTAAPSAFARKPVDSPVTPVRGSGKRQFLFKPNTGDKGMLKLAHGNLRVAAAGLPVVKRLARRFKKFVNNPLMLQYGDQVHSISHEISILSTDLLLKKKPPRVLASAAQKIIRHMSCLERIMKRVETYQARFASFGRLWISVRQTAGNDPVLRKLVSSHEKRVSRLTSELDGITKKAPDKWSVAELDKTLGELAYRVANFKLYLQHKATLLRWKNVLDQLRKDSTGGSVAYHRLVNTSKYRKLKQVVAVLERSAQTDEMDEMVPRSDGYNHSLANVEVPVTIGAQMREFVRNNQKLFVEFVKDVSAARLKTAEYKRLKAAEKKSAQTVKEFNDIQKTLKLVQGLRANGLKDPKKLKAVLERLLKYMEGIDPKFLKGLPKLESTALIRQMWTHHEKRRAAVLRKRHPGKRVRRPKPLSPMGPPTAPKRIVIDRNRRVAMAPPRFQSVPTTVTLRPMTPALKLDLVKSALRSWVNGLTQVIASGDKRTWLGRKHVTALATFVDHLYRNQFVQPIAQLADRAELLGDEERRLQDGNIAAVWGAKDGKEFMQKVKDASFYASNGAMLFAVSQMEKNQAELKKASKGQNAAVGFFVALGASLHMGVAAIKGDKEAQARIVQDYMRDDMSANTADTVIADARRQLLKLRKMYRNGITKKNSREFAHWSAVAPRILMRTNESLKRHHKGIKDFQWVATAGSLAILVAAAVASAYTGGATSGLLVNVGSGFLRGLLTIGAYSTSFATVQFLGDSIVFGKDFTLERFAKLQGKTFLTFLIVAPLMRGLNALLGIEVAHAGSAAAGQRLAVRLGQMYKLPAKYLDVLSGAVSGSKAKAWGQLILCLAGKGSVQLAGEIGIFTGADFTAAGAMGKKHEMGSLTEMAITILLLRRLNRTMEPSARRAAAGLLDRAIAKHGAKLNRLIKAGKLTDPVRIKMAEKGARLVQAYRIFSGKTASKDSKLYQAELSRYEKMYADAKAREARANPAGLLLQEFGLDVGGREGEAALHEARRFDEAMGKLSPADQAALKLNLRYYRPGEPLLELYNGVRLRRINHILKKAGYEVDGGTIKRVEQPLPIFNKPWSQMSPGEKAAAGMLGGFLIGFAMLNPKTALGLPILFGMVSHSMGYIRSGRYGNMGGNGRHNREARSVVDKVVMQLEVQGRRVDRGKVRRLVHEEMRHQKNNDGSKRNSNVSKSDLGGVADAVVQKLSISKTMVKAATEVNREYQLVESIISMCLSHRKMRKKLISMSEADKQSMQGRMRTELQAELQQALRKRGLSSLKGVSEIAKYEISTRLQRRARQIAKEATSK